MVPFTFPPQAQAPVRFLELKRSWRPTSIKTTIAAGRTDPLRVLFAAAVIGRRRPRLKYQIRSGNPDSRRQGLYYAIAVAPSFRHRTNVVPSEQKYISYCVAQAAMCQFVDLASSNHSLSA
jgi:hypothetical protein